nr:porin family protein [uncultured Bacteroides sp.]
MKKFLFFLVMTAFAINLMAQEEEEVLQTSIVDSSYKIYLGAKAGVNFSSMSGLDESFGLNPKSGLGYQGGLAANVHFGRRTSKSPGGTGLFGIQVEAMYSQRIIKTDIEDLKLSYFEVPILLQYYPMPSLSIEVGPTIVGSLSSSPDEIKTKNMTIATGELKGFDCMITAGVGYKHKSGFTASARYNLGMSELAGNFNGKVSTVTVAIGWMFSLNK